MINVSFNTENITDDERRALIALLAATLIDEAPRDPNLTFDAPTPVVVQDVPAPASAPTPVVVQDVPAPAPAPTPVVVQDVPAPAHGALIDSAGTVYDAKIHGQTRDKKPIYNADGTFKLKKGSGSAPAPTPVVVQDVPAPVPAPPPPPPQTVAPVPGPTPTPAPAATELTFTDFITRLGTAAIKTPDVQMQVVACLRDKHNLTIGDLIKRPDLLPALAAEFGL